MEEEDSAVDSSASSVSFCPSFNTYSSPKLVDDIAASVSLEKQYELQQNDDEEDFEFVSIKNHADACEFSFDGQIRQVFPVFNQDPLLDADYHDQKLLLPMKNLFMEEGPSSSSSSDADELEVLPEETYCVRLPNKNNAVSPNRCQKSNSTGTLSSSKVARSSKRWLKFRDFLKRSSSEGGKDSYAVLNKTKINFPPDSKLKQSMTDAKATGKTKTVSAHEAFYVKNAMKQGNKKKSYLPYRQNLLGCFSHVKLTA
ncbi:uncharacterized protein LOC123196184 [Mangifera indica]|uniref:uncharacterized protein LOC123196184 n=1 Tax=Mangifera indica TaxID=29780 RepID=UPI001CF9FFC2|nr:uncharacterized protein LOC123196184 [Mangifera indica]